MDKIYKIKDIRDKTTNLTHTDKRYPQKIGSTIYFDFFEPKIGIVAFLSYVTDNEGNPKEGTLRTSTIQNIERTENTITLYTHNSIYELEEVNKE